MLGDVFRRTRLVDLHLMWSVHGYQMRDAHIAETLGAAPSALKSVGLRWRGSVTPVMLGLEPSICPGTKVRILGKI